MGQILFRGSVKCTSTQQQAAGGRLTTFASKTIVVVMKGKKLSSCLNTVL
jgi:hypothetical protein